ncbi:MAG: TlpA disulfide reductase family protein [Phycisphaerales bacterium]
MKRLLPCLALLLAAAVVGSATAAPQYGKDSSTPRGRTPQKPIAPPAEPPAEGQDGDGKDKTPKGADNKGGEARYLEKMDQADRDALAANIGFLMPPPAGELDWIGGDAMMPADFRGKVTVIQSLSGKSGGRALLEKVKKQIPEGVTLLALHTPEQADRAQTVFGANPVCLMVVDRTGEWCAALGVWKRPVNIVIDKTGAVRFVGLSEQGMAAKLPALLQEEVDESVQAKPKPAPKAPAESAEKPTDWPKFNNAVQSAADMRGQKTPGFYVQKWITRQPDPSGRLVAIDFWATWCGPCRAAIPHVNELNAKFGNDVLFVGMSDESDNNFQQGLQKYKLNPQSFTYSLALDPKARLKKFFNITGIPHMAIMSPDGVVRWQGHPASLTEGDVQKLVDANKALTKVTANPGATRGWKSATSTTK